MQSAPNSSRSDGASEVRDRTGSGSSARSRAGEALHLLLAAADLWSRFCWTRNRYLSTNPSVLSRSVRFLIHHAGKVQLVAQNASDLPTVETSASSDSAAASGVQIVSHLAAGDYSHSWLCVRQVVTGPDGIARSVTFDRTDRLQEAFMIMQSAGLLPPDQLPWYTQDQQLSVADKVRFVSATHFSSPYSLHGC